MLKSDIDIHAAAFHASLNAIDLYTNALTQIRFPWKTSGKPTKHFHAISCEKHKFRNSYLDMYITNDYDLIATVSKSK